MSHTYDRVFGNIGKINPFGHAYLNSQNIQGVKKAKKELEDMFMVQIKKRKINVRKKI